VFCVTTAIKQQSGERALLSGTSTTCSIMAICVAQQRVCSSSTNQAAHTYQARQKIDKKN